MVTHAVVPAFPYSMLLAVLELTTARWQREAMWIVPVMVTVSMVRFAVIV